jgi:hypothetical protein
MANPSLPTKTRIKGPFEIQLRGASLHGGQTIGDDAASPGPAQYPAFTIEVPAGWPLGAIQVEQPGGTPTFVLLPDGAFQISLAAITGSGAVAVGAGNYVITDAGAAALTLAAPTAGTQDGLTIQIFSSTAFAHTLTATGLLQTGAAAVNVATFAAHAGAGLTLVAFNGLWMVSASVGITFS